MAGAGILVHAAGCAGQASGALGQLCGEAAVVRRWPGLLPAPRCHSALRALDKGPCKHPAPSPGARFSAGATAGWPCPSLLTPFHAADEAAGEEGHGHEQTDGVKDGGGDHGHLEVEGLLGGTHLHTLVTEDHRVTLPFQARVRRPYHTIWWAERQWNVGQCHKKSRHHEQALGRAPGAWAPLCPGACAVPCALLASPCRGALPAPSCLQPGFPLVLYFEVVLAADHGSISNNRPYLQFTCKVA